MSEHVHDYGLLSPATAHDEVRAELERFLVARNAASVLPELAAEGLLVEELKRNGWGTPGYPLASLGLTREDGELLKTEGIPTAQTAKKFGRSYTNTVDAWRLVRSKRGALDAARKMTPFEELDVWTRRTIILTGIFGKKWMTRDIGMIQEDAEYIIDQTRELEGDFGDAWKHWPSLAMIDPRVRRNLIARYDKEFGEVWRKSPGILALNPDVVAERAPLYDMWLGPEWRERPGILKTPPRTVISSMRALTTMGITPENTGPAIYSTLIATSMANKRNKVTMIRRDLLGHAAIGASSEKRSLGENVTARANVNKEQETKEMEAFLAFLPTFTLSRLMNSEATIKTWARKHPELIPQAN